MEQLSSQDQLRLNVLLANPFDAVRIDENNMILYALRGNEEAKVQLSPNCNHERYLRYVRELLSGQVLGSPGGYPVYLKRWTRMGQKSDDNLPELLKLGEPEAVLAVAGAPGLTDELARLVWWTSPTSEMARHMLERDVVVNGSMGKVLAEHLYEHLAFETEPLLMIESVRLMLKPGLLDEDRQRKLWDKGRKKRAYLVGFLRAMPDRLPELQAARHDYDQHSNKLATLAARNRYVALLNKTLSDGGQTFLQVTETVLQKPYNQDDVVALLNAMRDYLDYGCDNQREQDIDSIISECQGQCEGGRDMELIEALGELPDLQRELTALLILGRCGDAVVTPVFARSDAVGTVMRKRLAPVTAPIFEQLAVLLGRG
ncbi:MAG: sulfur reduction protein DsrS [Gammaproteobacteria bacterium]|nr:sulfur reduction protein DsrS [Gammaproteobacteria bacterium]